MSISLYFAVSLAYIVWFDPHETLQGSHMISLPSLGFSIVKQFPMDLSHVFAHVAYRYSNILFCGLSY
jgi:hypothetical protein